MKIPRRTDPMDELVTRVRVGDDEAFETLFRAYCANLCDYAGSFVASHAVAEDLVHDVFCDLWARRKEWAPSGSVEAYLFRAVRNKALNWLKHRRIAWRWEAEKRHQARPPQIDPETILWSRDLEQVAREAVDALPERQRSVFKMARERGMSYAEIAATLGIAPKTVENHMGRALKFLRERLEAYLFTPS